MRGEIVERFRSVLLCTLAAATVCCALALSPAYAAAFSWSQGTEVALPAHTQGDLYGVSCPASGSCVASGAFENAEEEIFPLVAFQSSGWGASALPLPAGATSTGGSGLAAISCPDTGYCVAVGTLDSGYGAAKTEALISTYAAGSWTSEALPAPAAEGDPPVATKESKTELTGVSCATPGSCVAVGSYEDQTNQEVAFIATQAEGKWTTEVLATPVEETGGQLAAISCTSASSCEAVGSYKSLASATQVNPMVATNEGGTWESATITLPAGTGANANAQLSGVSCTAAGECVADGGVEEGTSGEALVVTLDHGSSSTSAVATPSEGVFKLSGLSCPLSSFCAAAGELDGPNGSERAIGATLGTGGAETTTILEPPANILRESHFPAEVAPLAGVSCWEANGCVGVGYYIPVGGGFEPMVVSYGEQPVSTPPPSSTPPPNTSQTPSMPQATPLPMTTAAVPVIALKSKKITLAKGKAKVKLACSGAACAGKVKLEVRETGAKTAKKGKHGHGKKAKAKGVIAKKGANAKGHKLVVVAQTSYKLAAGKSETLKLKLTAKGKKALAKASRKHPVTVTILVTVKGGKQLKRTVKVI
jgi:hypothetical protein